MADRALLERLQPSLLDRLTDNAPGETTETNASWIIDISRLREIIQRDLLWLLNTTNFESGTDLDLYPQVAASVLNFGITDVSGTSATENRADQIRQAICTAIKRFEPRLLSDTLDVSIHQGPDRRGALISFDIRAELWAEPVPLNLYLRTQLDVTTGDVTLKRQN